MIPEPFKNTRKLVFEKAKKYRVLQDSPTDSLIELLKEYDFTSGYDMYTRYDYMTIDTGEKDEFSGKWYSR